MKKIFLWMAALLLLASPTFAASGASDMLPGGAVLGFWRCGDGVSTGFAIQNVKDFPVGVHIVVYDNCSQEIMNFTVPLSEHDIWGGTLSCSGGEIIIESLPSHFEGPNNGSETRRAPKRSDYGYIVAAVTQVGTNKLIRSNFANMVRACDGTNTGSAPYHCNNDDPRDDLNWQNRIVTIPNAIILRTIIGNLSGGTAMTVNGISILDFTNLGTLFGNNDDTNGIIVHLEELAAFYPDPLQVAGGNFALGSANGVYWASYNQACFETTLALIFPQSGHGCTNSIDIGVHIYDDNQNVTSASIPVPEVALIPLNTSIITYQRGFIRLQVKTSYRINYDALTPHPLPMFGYSIYEAPGAVAAFPIIPEQQVFCVSYGCFIVGTNLGPRGSVY